jgi:hypothetical protein
MLLSIAGKSRVEVPGWLAPMTNSWVSRSLKDFTSASARAMHT